MTANLELLHSLHMSLLLQGFWLSGWADAPLPWTFISQLLMNLFTAAALEITWYIVAIK